MRGNVNAIRCQGLVTAGFAGRAKKAFYWAARRFELLALTLAFPLDLGWADSLTERSARAGRSWRSTMVPRGREESKL